MPKAAAPAPSPRKVPIRQVEVTNFLSFRDISVKLDHLNILVGPNGGGKSNFLSVFRFLGEVARTDLAPALQTVFGGFDQARCRSRSAKGDVEISLKGEITEHSSSKALDEYSLSFSRIGAGPHTSRLRRREKLLLKRGAGAGRRITLNGAKYELIDVRSTRARSGGVDQKEGGRIEPAASALSALRRIGRTFDTKQVNQLAEVFEGLRLFDPVVDLARQPGRVGAHPHLLPDAANLASVLTWMNTEAPDVVEAIQDDVRAILPGFARFKFERGEKGSDTIRVDILEHGLRDATPMTRASFGTVRAIALLTMLRDPDPPRLTCLEEIDHGLHPYALDILVERLRDASSRSQIIVATHSPALVNRLEPKELIVFERDVEDGSTRIVQRETSEMEAMLDGSGFGLGELWFSGTLGGVP